jgi:Tfp pilus assembly protein FimT
MAINICQGKEYFQCGKRVEKKVSSFTLIELVTVIALVSVFSLFLVKLNFTAGNENHRIEEAILLLAASCDRAHGQAIGGNIYVKIFIDTSSDLKFRRVAIMKQKGNTWQTEHESILPERTFILSQDNCKEWLDNASPSAYTYVEEENILQGETVNGYGFIFTPEGHLSDAKTTILGIGYGAKVGGDITLKKDVNIYGLLITAMGSRIVLESKGAIKGAI